ncbi:MAG: DUF4249 domain-containing protein [Bacteroidia bacterium]
MLKILSVSTAVIFFTSCTDVVKVDLDPGETLLVVDAWVNDLPGTQNIKLTTTSPYFSNVNVPPVSGAAVVLSDLSNNKNYTFSDAGYGNYSFTPSIADTMCIVGHNYQLNISYQGNTYTSLAKLSRTTVVDSIVWQDLEGQIGTENGLFPYIIAKDSAGGKDFYWIKAYHNAVYINNPSNINVCEDAGGGDGTDGLYFIPPNAYFNVTPGNKPYKENDLCTIEIHSISKSSYDFLLQAQVQMTNSQSGLFASTPENVRTNINVVTSGAPKALGWFNMASTSVKNSVAHKP